MSLHLLLAKINHEVFKFCKFANPNTNKFNILCSQKYVLVKKGIFHNWEKLIPLEIFTFEVIF